MINPAFSHSAARVLLSESLSLRIRLTRRSSTKLVPAAASVAATRRLLCRHFRFERILHFEEETKKPGLDRGHAYCQKAKDETGS
jgi:hypothetical protein